MFLPPAFDVVVWDNNTKGQALLNRGKIIMAAVQDWYGFGLAGLTWLTWFTDCFTPCINGEKRPGNSPSSSHGIPPVYCTFHCIRSVKRLKSGCFRRKKTLGRLCLQNSRSTTELLQQVNVFDGKYYHTDARWQPS